MSASAYYGFQGSGACNVLIVYDQFTSGQHAVQMYHRLMLQHGEPANVNVKTCTFDLLENHEVNKTLVTDAAEAQVVIVAAASEEVPSGVEQWLREWREHSVNQHAEVVAVLSAPTGSEKSSSIVNQLKSVATHTGSELVVEKANAVATWWVVPTLFD